jgi:hypothetical protein
LEPFGREAGNKAPKLAVDDWLWCWDGCTAQLDANPAVTFFAATTGRLAPVPLLLQAVERELSGVFASSPVTF